MRLFASKWLSAWLIIIIGILIFAGAYFYFQYTPPEKAAWGLTFSYKEARGLGFEDQYVFADILADLKPKNVRLMTYWNDLEKEKGQFDFSTVDWQLKLAQKNATSVVLVLGRKQPRWPECHEPGWFDNLSADEQDEAVLNFIEATVKHFKVFDNIKAWQVENEPYFSFGHECSIINKSLLEREVELVKQLDKRPVVLTDSGERGSWIKTAVAGADILGSTLYRVSFDSKYGGYYKYPVPPIFYRIKSGFLKTFASTERVWDVELQMEPWFTNGALNTPLETQKALMNPKVFADNIKYAENSGFEEHYFWGVEWWYWMAKSNGDWGMWNVAKNFFQELEV